MELRVSSLSGAGLGQTRCCTTRGRTFYNWDIEDALWENYVEDGGNIDNDHEWVCYVSANAVDYLDNFIFEI